MKAAIVAIVLLFVAGLSASQSYERGWQLTFYFNEQTLLDYLYLGYFQTLEKCQISRLKLMQWFPISTFECSEGCRLMDPDGHPEGPSVCEMVYRERTGTIHE